MKSFLWPLGLLFSTDLTVIAISLNLQSPIREILAFWFLLVCPGMAFIRLFNFREIIVEWTLAIALSITINTLISEILVLNHIWSIGLATFLVAAFCITGSILQIVQVFRFERAGEVIS